MNFEQAFDKVIGHEGGYVDNPNDPGGETKYGISARTYPGVDIKSLTMADAKTIYKRDYWDACQCDQLPGWARFQVFDAAVNSGATQASRWLQFAVGAYGDGVIGAKTIAKARETEPGRGVAMFNAERLRFMTGLKVWPHFAKGWAKRIADNLREV